MKQANGLDLGKLLSTHMVYWNVSTCPALLKRDQQVLTAMLVHLARRSCTTRLA